MASSYFLHEQIRRSFSTRVGAAPGASLSVFGTITAPGDFAETKTTATCHPWSAAFMSSFQVEGLVPDDVMKKLKDFEASLEEVQRQLQIFLDMKNKDFETKNPLEKARIQLDLAHTINALFYMFLRTHGVAPEDHPVTRELQRLEHFQKKLEELEVNSDQLLSHEHETEERITDQRSTDVPSTGDDREQGKLREVKKSNSATRKRRKSNTKHHTSKAKEESPQKKKLHSDVQNTADKKKKHRKQRSQEAN